MIVVARDGRTRCLAAPAVAVAATVKDADAQSTGALAHAILVFAAGEDECFAARRACGSSWRCVRGGDMEA